MNHIKKIMAALSVVFFLQLTMPHVAAQSGTVQFIAIDKQYVQIKNLALVDSLGADNKMVHSAAFDIPIYNSKGLPGILSLLQSSKKNNRQLDIYFTKMNTISKKAVEERNYLLSLVKEIKLPEINAGSKEAYSLRVVIVGGDVLIKYDIATNVAWDDVTGGAAFKSNFNIELETLPTKRVFKVESMSISSDTKNAAAQQFNLELSATDERAWNEVYANGSGKVLSKGKIEMLSASLRDVLLTINLEEIKIVSYRTVTGNGQTIAKVSYGLQVGKISFGIK